MTWVFLFSYMSMDRIMIHSRKYSAPLLKNTAPAKKKAKLLIRCVSLAIVGFFLY